MVVVVVSLIVGSPVLEHTTHLSEEIGILEVETGNPAHLEGPMSELLTVMRCSMGEYAIIECR